MPITASQRREREERRKLGALPAKQRRTAAPAPEAGGRESGEAIGADPNSRYKGTQWALTPMLDEREFENKRVQGVYNFARDFTSPAAIGLEAASLAFPWVRAGRLAKKVWQSGKAGKAALGTAGAPAAYGVGKIAKIAGEEVKEGFDAQFDKDLSEADKTTQGLQGLEIALAPILGMGKLGAKGAKLGVAKALGKEYLPIPSPRNADKVADFYSRTPEPAPAPNRQADIQNAYKEAIETEAKAKGVDPEIEEVGLELEDGVPGPGPQGVIEHAKLAPQYLGLMADAIKRKPKDIMDFWFKPRSQFSEIGRKEAIKKGLIEFEDSNFTAGLAHLMKNPNRDNGWYRNMVNGWAEKAGYPQVYKGFQHEIGLKERQLNHNFARKLAGFRAWREDYMSSNLKNFFSQLGQDGEEVVQAVTRYSNTLGIQGSRYITSVKTMTDNLTPAQLAHVVDRVSAGKSAKLPEINAADEEIIGQSIAYWEEHIDEPLREWARKSGVTDPNLDNVAGAVSHKVTDDQFMKWVDEQFVDEAGNPMLAPWQAMKLAEGQVVKANGVTYDPGNLRTKFVSDMRSNHGVAASNAALINRVYQLTKRIAKNQKIAGTGADGRKLTADQWLSERVKGMADNFGDGVRPKAGEALRKIFEEDIVPITTASDIFTGDFKQMSLKAYLWNYPLIALPQMAYAGALNGNMRAMRYMSEFATRKDSREIFKKIADEFGAQELTQSYLHDSNLVFDRTLRKRSRQFTGTEEATRSISMMNGIDVINKMQMRLRKNPEDMRAREFFKNSLGLSVKDGDTILDEMIRRKPQTNLTGLDGWLNDDEFLQAGHHFLRMTGGNADPLNLPIKAQDPSLNIVYFLRKMTLVNLWSSQFVSRTSPAAVPNLMAQYGALTSLGHLATEGIKGVGGTAENVLTGSEKEGSIERIVGSYEDWEADPVARSAEGLLTGQIAGPQFQFLYDVSTGKPNQYDLMIMLAPLAKNMVKAVMDRDLPQFAKESLSGGINPMTGAVADTAVEQIQQPSQQAPKPRRRDLMDEYSDQELYKGTF